MKKNEDVFKWKGKKYPGYGDIIDKALVLRGKEQKEFVEAFYSMIGPYARSNIGYCSGYYDPTTAQRIMKIFNTVHPIFGNYIPSGKKAYKVSKEK